MWISASQRHMMRMNKGDVLLFGVLNTGLLAIRKVRKVACPLFTKKED